jgi:hypothetical protein
MSDIILRKIMEDTRALPDDLQERVLEYVHTLAHPQLTGVSGKELLRFAGAIPPGDLQAMRHAIELGCEQVDVNEW